MLRLIPDKCYVPSEDTPYDTHAAISRASVRQAFDADKPLVHVYKALAQYEMDLAAFLKERDFLAERHMMLLVWKVMPSKPFVISTDGEKPAIPSATYLNVVHPVVEHVVTLYSLMNMAYSLAVCSNQNESDSEKSISSSGGSQEFLLDAVSYGQLAAKIYAMFSKSKWFEKCRSYLPKHLIQSLYTLCLSKIQQSTALQCDDITKKAQLLAYTNHMLSSTASSLKLLCESGYNLQLLPGETPILLVLEQAKVLAALCVTIASMEEQRGWTEFAECAKREGPFSSDPRWEAPAYTDAPSLALWYFEILEREIGLKPFSAELQIPMDLYLSRVNLAVQQVRQMVYSNHASVLGMMHIREDIDQVLKSKMALGIPVLMKCLHFLMLKNPFVAAHEKMPSVAERVGLLMRIPARKILVPEQEV